MWNIIFHLKCLFSYQNITFSHHTISLFDIIKLVQANCLKLLMEQHVRNVMKWVFFLSNDIYWNYVNNSNFLSLTVISNFYKMLHWK